MQEWEPKSLWDPIGLKSREHPTQPLTQTISITPPRQTHSFWLKSQRTARRSESKPRGILTSFRWLACQPGERTSIEAATIAGDIRDVLKSIVQIEHTIVTHEGVCPHIWVDGLAITGDA